MSYDNVNSGLYNPTLDTNYARPDRITSDYLSREVPRDMKELFSLVEYLAFNSGQVVSALKKLTEFPITKPIFNTSNLELKEKHEDIADKAKYKSLSLIVGFDYNMYGNSITSVYRPIIRYIICPSCEKKIKLKDADFKYHIKEDCFYLYNCKSCGSGGKSEILDIKDKDVSKVNIIRWDLRNIDIDYNSFSGKSTYYYSMTEEERRKIKDNDLDTLATYPLPMLSLAGRDKRYRFKFADDFVFHMKTPCLSGISKVWGFPPPTPALRSFFYQLLLRKSNEAVAYDYMNHLRVIYPEMSSPDNNPMKYINLSVWKEEMVNTVKQWRSDKNFIKISPHPIGYQALGGEGRGLLLSNEIREASYDILMALGIPRELMEGSSAQAVASPVMLRIIENMMLTYMEQMVDWLNWVDGKISNWLEIEPVDVEFLPFKFVDDIEQKKLLMQWGQGGEAKKISDTTLADRMDVDLEDEDEKIIEDTIRQYKLQKKIEKRIQEEENSLAAQAEQTAAQADGSQVDYNNQQQTMGQAEQMATQLMQVPYEQRKSHLDALQKEDFIMYSVVTQMMEKVKLEQKNSVINAARTV